VLNHATTHSPDRCKAFKTETHNMKKGILFALITLTSFTGIKANDLNNDLVELAKIYRNFMFRNSPNETTFEQLDKIESNELIATTKFIKETISTNNKLTTEEFLKLPDEQTMKFIYIVRRINWNIREENPKDCNTPRDLDHLLG